MIIDNDNCSTDMHKCISEILYQKFAIANTSCTNYDFIK